MIHIVKAGETLTQIARSYSVSPLFLQEQNKLPNPNQLVVGQCILIPDLSAPKVPLLLNGYAYPFIKEDILAEALPVLSSVTIFGYGFRTDGTLLPLDDEPLLSLLSTAKVEAMMLLSAITPYGGFSSELASYMMNNPTMQEVLLDNILFTMEQKGYIGLDIDFEYIPTTDKDAFIGFVEYAASRLHSYGYRVNVDLAPKVSSTQAGLLYEAHDYAALGSIADTVLLMTYEWGYTYGPPMAVAPLNQVKRVLDYAITEIPADKIYMGIPNYGYDWALPFERGITQAVTIGNEEAIELASYYNTEIQFDPLSVSPFFYYSSEAADTALTPHVVWFEDLRSMQAKLETALSYQFKGIGYWNLMRPFPQNWLLAKHFSIVDNGTFPN